MAAAPIPRSEELGGGSGLHAVAESAVATLLTALEKSSPDFREIPALLQRIDSIRSGWLASFLGRVVRAVNDQAATSTAPVERLLSTKEARERMGVSRDWLYEHAGQLSFSRRLGRRWKFCESGVNAWIRGERAKRGEKRV